VKSLTGSGSSFFDNTREAGMMCETAEKRTEGMEGNGGGLPK